jgi:demethylspheroidene O-methyltransferase
VAALPSVSVRVRSWREVWIEARNRLIASPRFQRWAADSPFTRAIARRRARALFDLCAGFVYSQIVLAGVRLRLFEYLGKEPRSVEAVSAHSGLSREAAQRLLRAAAALRLFRELPDGRYGLDDLGAALLGNPAIGELIEHHGLLYDDLRDPVALLRRERPTSLGAFWPYAADRGQSAPAKEHASAGEAGPDRYGAYSALMSRTQPLVADDILDSYPVARHACLLDVGGGEGAFVAASASRAPRLRLMLFDLPPVAERAGVWLSRRGLAGRVEIHRGDFLRDPLPRGADLIAIVRVLHDHDDEASLALLRAAYEALPSGGAVLVAEPMSGARGAEPVGDAYFGLYLWAMGQGRPRETRQVAKLLRDAGFGRVRRLKTRRPLLASALIARRT